MIDIPFAPPEDIVLELPPPLSVNRTRKIDWKQHKKSTAWLRQADAYFLMQKKGLPPPILGRFQITITLREGSRTDLDNNLKQVIDFIRRLGLISDDNPTHMRRIIVEFGDVLGCRVRIRAIE